jgi:hypothetical protein
VNLRATIQEATAIFILPEDHDALWNLASHHPTIKQVTFYSLPIFAKHFQYGYKEVIVHARNLEGTWGDLVRVADSIPGEMAVSIPDPWLE